MSVQHGSAQSSTDLPPPPGRIRRFLGRHPWIVDVALVLAYLLASAPGLLAPLAEWTTAVGLISTVINAGGLLLRRRTPWATFSIIATTSLALVLCGLGADGIAFAVAVYALFVYRSSRDGWIGYGIAVVGFWILLPLAIRVVRLDLSALTPFSVDGFELRFLPVSAVPIALFLLVPALLGASIGNRRRYIGAIIDRAERLAHERDQQARIATLAERARIAREMHDIVAHSLSVMISLSDGANALAERDPRRSRDAIAEVGTVGREALAEMRTLLSVLDGEADDAASPSSPEVDATPDLDALPDLVEKFRLAGLRVLLETEGRPPSNPGAQNTIYRIVQETLTNALRYAGPSSEVRVSIACTRSGTTIVTTDDGTAASASVGSGRGLIGVRERAQLYRGSVEAGPLPERGWCTRVTLPDARGDE